MDSHENQIKQCVCFDCSFEFEVLGSAELGPPPHIAKPNFDPCCISIRAKLDYYPLPCFTLLLFPIKCKCKALSRYDLHITCPLPAGVFFNVTLISLMDTAEHYMRSQIVL